MTTEPLAEPAMRGPGREAARRSSTPPRRRSARPDDEDAPGDAGTPAAARRGRGVSGPLLLAIETSCDETGVAIVRNGRLIEASIVASQVAIHAAKSGNVPRSPPANNCAGSYRRWPRRCARRRSAGTTSTPSR